VLVGLLVVQTVVPVRTDIPEPSSVLPRHPKTLASSGVTLYPQILDRPIFAPDRRSWSGGDIASPTGDESGAAAIGVSKLVGLALGPRVATAVVRAPSGHSRVVRSGDLVDGWRVQSVSASGLLLRREQDHKVLRMVGDETEPEPGEQTGEATQ
jgi:hypothetical protein